VEAFDRRLDRAARSVCRVDEFRAGTSVVSREARACYKQTRKHVDNRLAAIVAKKARG
jgi:UrcA family protein